MRKWLLIAMLAGCAADSAPPGDVPFHEEVDLDVGPAEVIVGNASSNKTTPTRLELSWSSFVTHQPLNSDWCPDAWGWGVSCLKSRNEREAYFRDYNSSGGWRTIAGMELDLGWDSLAHNAWLPSPWVYMVCITGLWCQDVSNARSGIYHGWDGVSYGQGWMQIELYLVAPAGTTPSTPKLAPRAWVVNLYVTP
jgi:hypothetical protein